jgi:hypothetical protein
MGHVWGFRTAAVNPIKKSGIVRTGRIQADPVGGGGRKNSVPGNGHKASANHGQRCRIQPRPVLPGSRHNCDRSACRQPRETVIGEKAKFVNSSGKRWRQCPCTRSGSAGRRGGAHATEIDPIQVRCITCRGRKDTDPIGWRGADDACPIARMSGIIRHRRAHR